LEILFGYIKGPIKKKEGNPRVKYVISSGAKQGKTVTLVGDTLNELQFLKTNIPLTAKGEFTDKETFSVFEVSEGIKSTTYNDLAILGQITGSTITEAEYQECLAALGVTSFYDATSVLLNNPELLDGINEETANKFRSIAISARKNTQIFTLSRLFKKSKCGLDMTHAATIYHTLKRRADRNEKTVPELVYENPWVITQALMNEPIERIEKSCAALAEYLNVDRNQQRVYQIASLIIGYLFETQRRGDCFAFARNVRGRAWSRIKGITNDDFNAAINYLTSSQGTKTFGRIIMDTKNTYNAAKQCDRVPIDKNTGKEIVSDNQLCAFYLAGSFFSEYESARMLSDYLKKPVEKWDADRFINIAKDKGYCLNSEQEKFIESVCNKRITILTGEAGTGKSTAVKALVDAYHEIEGLHPLVLAPTALAAYRAAANTVSEGYARTVHRFTKLIFEEVDLATDDILTRQTMKLIAATAEKISLPLIIVDESSMMTPVMLRSLLQNTEPETRFVFAGDPGQLPPIGMGGTFPALINLARTNIPTIELVELKENYRSDEGIIEAANFIRKGNPLPNNSDSFEIIAVSDEKEAVKKITAQVQELLKQGVDFEDIMVLAPTRWRTGGISILNEALRPIYGVIQKIPRTRFYVGDVVVATCNDYLNYAHVPGQIRKLRKERVEVFNGTRGKIEEYKDGMVQIRFPQGLCAYDPEELDHYVEPAYAMTVHKAQGGQAKHVIISLLTGTANRSLIYTAITRCKKGGSVTIVCQKDFVDNPPYVDEEWASLSERENGETPLPAEKCLSKLYLRVMQDLPISFKGI